MSINVFMVVKAVVLAERWHRVQRRKYTEEPYISHPLEVALMVAAIPGISTAAVVAAILHDVHEDCGVSIETITRVFGKTVGRYVKWLSDKYDEFDGNRDDKLLMTIERFKKIPTEFAFEVHTVKLADICCNTNQIIIEDPAFAKKYMPEKRELLKILTKGHPSLLARAHGLIQQWEFFEAAAARNNWTSEFICEKIQDLRATAPSPYVCSRPGCTFNVDGKCKNE